MIDSKPLNFKNANEKFECVVRFNNKFQSILFYLITSSSFLKNIVTKFIK